MPLRLALRGLAGRAGREGPGGGSMPRRSWRFAVPIVLNHTIVPARDKAVSAQFFAAIFDLPVGAPAGPFLPVAVNRDLTFDFAEPGAFEPHHYAFFVDEATFEAALGRLRERGATIGSGPYTGWDGQVDRSDGGQRVYVRDPDGHSYELFTRL